MLFEKQSENALHLLEKIETADAILVGAAAGMSSISSTTTTVIFRNTWVSFIKNMGIPALSTVSIIGIHLLRPAGHFWPGCVIWNTNLRRENRTMT